MTSTNKIQLSKLGSKELDHLASRLDLRPNIVCRLAIGRSLEVLESVKEFKRTPTEEKTAEETTPKEFNRFTLTGDEDSLYKILIYQHEYKVTQKKICENQYFKYYFQKHIERGLDLLFYEYQRVNSPIEFLKTLVNPIQKKLDC